MDRRRAAGRSCNELSVLVVDENPCHARATQSTLAQLNFQAMVYTSPVKALNFIKNHVQHVDFVLVAVHMKEMNGFKFLDMSREMHRNLQVIMMSVEATWPIMQRCVDLGARFLVKKPLRTNTIRNIWQYLDQKRLRAERIKNLFKGIRGNTYGVNFSGEEGLQKTLNEQGQGTRKKTLHLIWTPFLQNKFLHALDLLGDGATPKKIQALMNVNSIDRKQISTHLQKHRKRMEKDCKRCSKSYSNSKSWMVCETIHYNNDILPAEDITMEEMPNSQTEVIIEHTQDNKIYVSMQKALQFGTVYDEQLSNKTSAGEILNEADTDQEGAVKLVTYSDSEDDGDTTVNAWF